MNDALIICEGDKYIVLDNHSGGYPNRVTSPWGATHWAGLADARAYCERFPKENWTIKVFRATPLWDVTSIPLTDGGHE